MTNEVKIEAGVAFRLQDALDIDLSRASEQGPLLLVWDPESKRFSAVPVGDLGLVQRGKL